MAAKITIAMISVGIALSLFTNLDAMAQGGCRGTNGMTSCSFPPPDPPPPRDFKPHPAGPDTGGPGRTAPPSGKIPKDYRPPRPMIAK